jgi:RNA polymerase sigma-70 factor (ECF subfamily)
MHGVVHTSSLAADSLENEVSRLYDLHAAALFRYACRKAGSDETAREGLQETFLRYFVERSYGREIRHPKAWLFEVLRNYVSDRLSNRSARQEITGENIDRLPDLSQDPEVCLEGSRIARKLAANLSARELECLCLRTEGLSYGEIGATMRLQTGTVGALLARAHDKIRKFAAGDSSAGNTLAAAVFYLVRETASCVRT